jgi:hypothetical protein
MSKPVIFSIIAVLCVVIGSSIFAFNSSKNNTNSSSSSTTSQSNPTSKNTVDNVAVIDPNGEYKLFSDPSIIKQPEKNAVFGNGQTISLEYDQSKGEAGTALFYKLYYVDKKGVVFQLTDSRFETKAGNTYSTSNKVFNSDADGLNGFMEVFFVKDAKITNETATGTTVKLGMYAIKFETDKS